MNITDFTKPTEHPFNMLKGFGLRHTSENENWLAFVLVKCVEAGEFKPVENKPHLSELVRIGMLREVPDGLELTRKGKGYLYAYYGAD